MPIPLAVPIIAGAASFISGLFANSAAKKAEREAAEQQAVAQRSLNALVNDRQKVINPFDNVQNLSSMLSNPMANLSVATQAAEIQIEQADISLANTLDAVRATGASAGGATALAQAALQSKKNVSASIEAQEAQNERSRAQGEQRLQEKAMLEAQRIQSAESQGEQFVFNAEEQRDLADMDRLSAQISGATQGVAQARSDRTSALTGTIGSLSSIAGSYMEGGGSAAPKSPTTKMGGPVGQFDISGKKVGPASRFDVFG